VIDFTINLAYHFITIQYNLQVRLLSIASIIIDTMSTFPVFRFSRAGIW